MNDIDACDSSFNAIYGDEFWEATDAARRVFRSGWNAGAALGAKRSTHATPRARVDDGSWWLRDGRERTERDERRSRSED